MSQKYSPIDDNAYSLFTKNSQIYKMQMMKSECLKKTHVYIQ